MNITYSYISIPRTYRYKKQAYTLRNGKIYYNLILICYIEKLHKNFGVEISLIPTDSNINKKYENNSKYTIIDNDDHSKYIIEVCMYDTRKKPHIRHRFLYDDFGLPEKVYKGFINKIYDMAKDC